MARGTRTASTAAADAEAMRELRRLVVGNDERLVADALPRAVVLRARTDRQLAHALAPVIAETVGEVARNDPEKLAGALQPMIGHAVRKAVSAAFSAMVERVNQALEHTFSVRALRWRLEAARTGRPFAELVLVHSLVFRVEQIFLVHRRTGLLLVHAASDPEAVQDPDQVAAMLNVIEKFVHHAFREGASLTRFEVGELQGRVEAGAEAAITAVVRGTPPPELQQVLRDALERIHIEYADALASFRGDTARFELARPILEDCLIEQRRERRRSPVLPIVAAAVVLFVLALIVRGVLVGRAADRELQQHADALRALPGVVVSDVGRDGKDFWFRGLRDPLAPDPASILTARGVAPEHVRLQFEPFFSTDPRLAEPRARRALAAPETTGLVFRDGTIVASGIAPREWISRARVAASLLPGVSEIDLSSVREREAVDEVRSALARVDGASISFASGSTAVEPADLKRLDALARDFATMHANAARAGVRVRLAIDGNADATGSTRENLSLSRRRADAVAAALFARGVPLELVVARGAGEASDARRARVRVLLEGVP